MKTDFERISKQVKHAPSVFAPGEVSHLMSEWQGRHFDIPDSWRGGAMIYLDNGLKLIFDAEGSYMGVCGTLTPSANKADSKFRKTSLIDLGFQ